MPSKPHACPNAQGVRPRADAYERREGLPSGVVLAVPKVMRDAFCPQGTCQSSCIGQSKAWALATGEAGHLGQGAGKDVQFAAGMAFQQLYACFDSASKAGIHRLLL